MTNLVFFGAGASRPFGILTMQEMVSEFEKTLKDDQSDLFQFYSKIKETLVKEYGDSKIDIESMFSVIKGIATNAKPAELGHFVFYYISDNNSHKEFSPDEIKLAKKLQKQLQDYIREACKIKINQDEINKIYRESYLPLFKYIGSKMQDYNGELLSQDWKAYTTNYDNVFEDFWDALDETTDHFRKLENSNNYHFTTNLLQREHTFCKLHGSLNWTKEVKTDKIIRKTRAGFELFKTEGEVMLFPMQQKDLYLHPWFTLFQDLKLGLSNKIIWYVIGYAFNDEFIKNAFQEALESDSGKKLVIINPKAEQIKDKFIESVRNQIDVLPIKFGDEFFESQFEDYVKKVKTIVLRFDITDGSPEIVGNKLTVQSNHNIQSAKILNKEVKIMNSNIDGNTGNIYDKSKKHKFFEIQNPENVEVKMELKIEYTYDDEIELYISDGTEKVNVGIDYVKKMIASFKSAEENFGVKDNYRRMKDLIKLDKTKLYH